MHLRFHDSHTIFILTIIHTIVGPKILKLICTYYYFIQSQNRSKMLIQKRFECIVFRCNLFCAAAMAMHASRLSLFNGVKNYVKSHMIQMRLCKDFCANVVSPPPLPDLAHYIGSYERWRKTHSLTSFSSLRGHCKVISLSTYKSLCHDLIRSHFKGKYSFRNIGWGFIVLFLCLLDCTSLFICTQGFPIVIRNRHETITTYIIVFF